ncbi:MAG: hypothetical protein ACLQRH_04965 [Acidimicrobiales bacterium]
MDVEGHLVDRHEAAEVDAEVSDGEHRAGRHDDPFRAPSHDGGSGGALGHRSVAQAPVGPGQDGVAQPRGELVEATGEVHQDDEEPETRAEESE